MEPVKGSTTAHSTYSSDGHSFRADSLGPIPVLNAVGDQLLIGKRRESTARHRPANRNFSKPTEFLLHSTENYSLVHGILSDTESRRIFYFMILNLAFMVVQSSYGFLTGSLGLISDSIHMFFDCVALLVGVCAAVMSKWPPSVKFPYGYGKIDTLAALGNGIFLMLISIEIVYEAIERLFSGADVSRTTELLVVSTMGLFVNLVGILVFHGHHDHGHGHSHGGQSHDNGHAHDDHDGDRLYVHSGDPSALMLASASPTTAQKAAGGHHHGGENMEGIYLHILADALGSLAVVVSTVLVQTTGWSGFDPLASCVIAVLIFVSTVPLVSNTTKILLLSLNSDVEYNLRDILAGVSTIKGVVGYTVPKFWLEDTKKDAGHGHHHGHDHDHHGGHEHDRHHQHKDSNDTHSSHCDSENPAVLGVIHIMASQTADLEDVKERVLLYLGARKMDVIVQVEREGEGRCWCAAGLKTG